jgi:hypothetical protein
MDPSHRRRQAAIATSKKPTGKHPAVTLKGLSPENRGTRRARENLKRYPSRLDIEPDEPERYSPEARRSLLP